MLPASWLAVVKVVELEDLGPCFLGHFDGPGDKAAAVAFSASGDPEEVAVWFDVLAGVDSLGFLLAAGAFHADSSSG